MARTTTAIEPGPDAGKPRPPAARGEDYTVVARRYRPQRFEDVVGQDHVVQALRNAIRLGRVTHAYLFCGTRGVGKTSIARIFAKCLNCVHGPTVEPCNVCEICKDISVGQDVDVIEIDGASNNGVESVRELRQNAGLRPSRARTKIYYIDEVHMLSTGAFNALLKTLEEPPEHVKFLFATTEPNKIPITVLSRCQRYDFAGIKPEEIVQTLVSICEREGVAADPDALRALARRAGGSMRDAQSLLEQILSYGGDALTAETVHKALGLAPDDQVLELIEALAHREPGRALILLDEAIGGGAQPADLLSEALEFLRDVMVLAAGGSPDLLASSPSTRDRLAEIAGRWPLDTLLAAIQILSEARGRLRGSPHVRLLVEFALCRVARLEDFAELGQVLGYLRAAEIPPPDPEKKKRLGPEPRAKFTGRPSVVEESNAGGASATTNLPAGPESDTGGAGVTPSLPGGTGTPSLPCGTGSASAGAVSEPDGPRNTEHSESSDLPSLWARLVERVGSPWGARLARLRPEGEREPGVLFVPVPSAYNYIADRLGAPDVLAKINNTLRDLAGRPLVLRLEVQATEAEVDGPPSTPRTASAEERGAVEDDPLIRDVLDRFDAKLIRVEPLEGPES